MTSPSTRTRALARCSTRTWSSLMTSVSYQPQLLLEAGAEHLAESDMHLLDARRRLGGDQQQRIGKPRQPAALAARERRRHEPHRLRALEPRNDVRAAARGGDSHGEIARPAQRLDLAGEDALEAQIVARRRQGGAIG